MRAFLTDNFDIYFLVMNGKTKDLRVICFCSDEMHALHVMLAEQPAGGLLLKRKLSA